MKHRTLLLSLLVGLSAHGLAAQEVTETDAPSGKAVSPSGSVELPGADVVGNRELPVGLDIVPWRPSSSGLVKEGPTQLLDVPLRPIDPEVFRRELSIYQQANQP